MHRRILLRAAGLAGLAGLLNACGQTTRDQNAAAPSSTGMSTFDPVGMVAPDADEVLSIISGSFEQLVGTRPFAFGIVGADNTPVTGADVQVWVVPVEGSQPTGPSPATFHDVPGQPLGLYVAEVDLLAPGPTSFVAVTSDQRAGSDTVQVATPDTSQLPAPGQPAISVATPTTADAMGLERLCTANPSCGMHEVSLDQALAAGRPVMLTFATPAYCQTAVCGPSVGALEQVRTSRDWDETAFIHVEIYSDAGQTVSEPVTAWRLPSEPWLFAIAADGTLADRADGPLLTLADHLTTMTEQIQ